MCNLCLVCFKQLVLKIDTELEIFPDVKWIEMTTREGVAREAPKNIPPKKLLMVSRFLSNSILLHFHCALPYAELDFSRGIWAAARDGEEDRVKHLLSRLLPTYPPLS